MKIDSYLRFFLGEKRMFRWNPVIGLIFAFILISFSSCYYDSNEELYGDLPCKTGTISYSADVVPVLSANCYGCHSISSAPVSGNGIVLENYTNLIDFLSTGESIFTGSIEHNGNGAPMPEDGTKMDKCSIGILKNWIAQGKLNN